MEHMSVRRNDESASEDLSTHDYLEQNLGHLLRAALKVIVRIQPKDPIAYLSSYLLLNKIPIREEDEKKIDDDDDYEVPDDIHDNGLPLDLSCMQDDYDIVAPVLRTRHNYYRNFETGSLETIDEALENQSSEEDFEESSPDDCAEYFVQDNNALSQNMHEFNTEKEEVERSASESTGDIEEWFESQQELPANEQDCDFQQFRHDHESIESPNDVASQYQAYKEELESFEYADEAELLQYRDDAESQECTDEAAPIIYRNDGDSTEYIGESSLTQYENDFDAQSYSEETLSAQCRKEFEMPEYIDNYEPEELYDESDRGSLQFCDCECRENSISELQTQECNGDIEFMAELESVNREYEAQQKEFEEQQLQECDSELQDCEDYHSFDCTEYFETEQWDQDYESRDFEQDFESLEYEEGFEHQNWEVESHEYEENDVEFEFDVQEEESQARDRNEWLESGEQEGSSEAEIWEELEVEARKEVEEESSEVDDERQQIETNDFEEALYVEELVQAVEMRQMKELSFHKDKETNNIELEKLVENDEKLEKNELADIDGNAQKVEQTEFLEKHEIETVKENSKSNVKEHKVSKVQLMIENPAIDASEPTIVNELLLIKDSLAVMN